MNDHCHPLGLKLPLFLQKKPDFKTLVSRGGCGMGSSAPYEYNWKFSKLPSVEMKWWSGKNPLKPSSWNSQKETTGTTHYWESLITRPCYMMLWVIDVKKSTFWIAFLCGSKLPIVATQPFWKLGGLANARFFFGKVPSRQGFVMQW